MTKTKTMIWKRMNFTAGKKIKNTPGMNQLKTSLEHSLRLIQKDDLEFNKDLIHRNAIYFGGKTRRLDQLSLDERQSIHDSIFLPLTQTKSDSKELVAVNSELSKYAYKIKKLINKNESAELSTFLEALLNSDQALNAAVPDAIRRMNVSRIDQKIGCISKYIELKKKSLQLTDPEEFSLRKTVIQEAFWKFPLNQLVDNVRPAHYMDIINSFYKENLPNYPVKLIVFHGDEVTSPEDDGLGAHPHIFIDGKNKKTCKYDLISDEFAMINDYLAKQGREPINDRNFTSAQLLGKTYQEMVYAHVNKQLAKFGYDITVEVLPDTPAKQIRNRLIKKDTSRPKIYRLYNSITKSTEDLQKINASIAANHENKKKLDSDIERIMAIHRQHSTTNADLVVSNRNLEIEIDNNSGILDNLLKKEVALKSIENDIATKTAIIKSKEAEIFELDIKIEAKRTYYEKLEDAFSSIKKFVSACIHRNIRYDEVRPPKHQLKEVNDSLDLIYENIHAPEGIKMINKLLDDQELEFEKNNIPVEFSSGFLSKKRFAKYK